jgi:hypothetical protein
MASTDPMDFGGFILFGVVAVGLLAGSVLIVAAFATRRRGRWRDLGVWFAGALMLVVLGRHLHQVYWLDEPLVLAAAQGDTARVRALLTAGASPRANWEDGTTALAAARAGGHREVVLVLQQAGAAR